MKNRRFTPYLVLAGFTSALITTNLAFEEPVPVHADFGNFDGAVDYIAGLSDDEVVALGSSAGGGYVAGAVLGIYLCTKNPLQVGEKYSADSLTIIPGQYISYRDGVRTLKFGTVLAHSGTNVPSSGGFTFAYSDDFELRTTTAGSIIISYNASSSSDGQYNITALDNNQNYVSQIWTDVKGYFTNVNVGTSFWGGNVALLPSSLPTLTYGSAIPCNSSDWNIRPALLKAGQTVTLPSGDIDPVDPMVYIDNVLRPFVEINYPDYIYLLPEPEPEPPQYATDDIVPGIPKDWTIINPELPTAPHFEINVPDADFSVLDVSETIAQYVIPIGFWFTLLDQTLDALHLKVILYVALAFGLLIYIVWKLGR